MHESSQHQLTNCVKVLYYQVQSQIHDCGDTLHDSPFDLLVPQLARLRLRWLLQSKIVLNLLADIKEHLEIASNVLQNRLSVRKQQQVDGVDGVGNNDFAEFS